MTEGNVFTLSTISGGEYPISGLDRGGYPIPSLEGGYPIAGLDGLYPHSRSGWGNTLGYPSPHSVLNGVHPPPIRRQGVTTWQAVCLLRSHKRTFLFRNLFGSSTVAKTLKVGVPIFFFFILSWKMHKNEIGPSEGAEVSSAHHA